ncbi:pre-mRNA-splicing factor rse-1 [Fusarium beomiforme]|uniref:Pre-mRNA-splicing factor rse-1 n=1 Tax=Fusarium beomiforme TaxID=44412 RepID=A0A9P5DS46_9HYPO|nr:pre-mRNA-splicing factor rse-1 [Fusarium beomiforme]
MATTSNMFLYSLSLQPPTAISQAIVGQFSGTKEQHILTVSGSLLTLYRPDPTHGRVQPLVSHDVFSIIRSVASFRLAGSSKDYIIVATDSGRIASGVRRTVPGEYLAADPRGRACIIASIEKNKLVYVLNRNAQAELTISSPLEAHKPGVLVLSLVALDVGYSNPVFAALEIDYSESDQDPSGQVSPEVELVYYELDLGLNHVVRKWSEPVDPTAALLFQVPGGNDGPSGVLVCGDESIMYRHSNQEPLRLPIPRRQGATEDPQRKRTIIGGVMHKLKNSPEAFFFLLQTEDGDLFKVTFDMQHDGEGSLTGEVWRIKIKYFDTVPVASSLCILKSGFLFVATEFGNHHFYQFEKLGDDDAEPAVTSEDFPTDPRAVYQPVYFYPRALENLALYDAYIILTSSENTLVMSVGDEVEQVSDSGFLTTVTTLAIQQIGDDGLVQIHPKGIRHLRGAEINEWPVPQHRSIIAVATNEQQIAVALSLGEIVYFETDSDGSLADLGRVPEGRLRSPVLAVGCEDCTVRILSLDPDSTLENKSIQALTAAPSSLSIMSMEDPLSSSSGLYLHIGLSSGVYLRTGLDEITGVLTDTQTRFLGLRAIKLFQVTAKGRNCVLALSSKPWMGYTDPKRGFMMTPLDCNDLEWGWNFSSEQCEEGIIAIHANFLHIFSIEDLYDNLVRKSVPLTYTPRHFVKHPHEPYFYTVEADNNTLGPELRAQLLSDDNRTNGDAKVLPPEEFGYPRGRGRWASCISIVDPIGEQVLQKIDLENNEAATSVAVVPFISQDSESFLLVGTGKDMVLNPRQFSEGYIHVYRFQNNGRELEFIHKTKVEEPPMALVAFQGSRIVVGDLQQGVTMVVFDQESRKLIPFIDDAIARWTTCTAMADYESVVGGDKFGNLWIVRCPEKTSQEADEPGNHLSNARNYLNGASSRLDSVAHFFTQDIPTSIAKASLILGGQDVIVWSGLQGTIGVLIPFVTREDADFFHTLEEQMRTEDPSPVGRDHLMYRGRYVPAKGVIDGDLCERYRLLPADTKQQIASELDRSDVRTRSAF